MTVDIRTAMAAQRAKAEILAWIYDQIRRDIRVRAANEAAAKHASDRKNNPDHNSKRRAKKPKARDAWQSPWPRSN